MGQSTDAVLAYGYDLGGDEGEWKIRETDEYGSIDASNASTLAWYDEDSDDDFRTQAERRLLAEIAGFTETWDTRVDDDYFKREREAEERLGVKFESYCSGDYPMYVLATKVITVYRGDSKILDLPALTAEPAAHGWDDKLRQACEVLGITPKPAGCSSRTGADLPRLSPVPSWSGQGRTPRPHRIDLERGEPVSECTCYAPDDAEPEDHDLDCPEHPTGEED